MPNARQVSKIKRTVVALVLGLSTTATAGLVAVQQAAASPPPTPPPSDSPAVDSARDLGQAFSTVAERVSPAVVSIRVEARVAQQRAVRLPFGLQAPQNDGVAHGTGSGFVIRPDGYILTNNHVVEHAMQIEVRLQDGRRFDAQVVGTDPATDLAVVRIPARGLTAASFADSRGVRPGQWAIAIGSPFGLDYTVTTGVVSSVGRGGLGMNEIEDYIQTDASINPGNSGGPLVDLDGRVIGINTMIVGRGTGIGFAVSSELARRVADQLIEHGRVRRPWIGVQFQELTPELASAFSLGNRGRAGALIADVVSGGPADRSGLHPGDVVVSVDGQDVHEGRDLLRAVLRHDVGSRVQLVVMRSGRPMTVMLQTQERPGTEQRDARAGQQPTRDDADASGHGLSLQALSPQQQAQVGGPGTLVAEVQPGSDADHAGLRPGDVIVEADGQRARGPQAVANALRDGHVLLRVHRGEGAFYTVLSD